MQLEVARSISDTYGTRLEKVEKALCDNSCIGLRSRSVLRFSTSVVRSPTPNTKKSKTSCCMAPPHHHPSSNSNLVDVSTSEEGKLILPNGEIADGCLTAYEIFPDGSVQVRVHEALLQVGTSAFTNLALVS
jgi:hypothetical protein